MSLLTDSDRRNIEQAVARLEERSAAEFVVAVVKSSASYSRFRALLAGAWAVAAALLYFRYVPWGAEGWALAVELPVGLLAWALFGVPTLHRRLIVPKEVERAVQENAFRIFAEHGVYMTEGRTGMLLLVSELEHRVVLLGDRGVDELVGKTGWRDHVDHLVDRIKREETAAGIVELIERLGAVLEAKVPVLPNDRNELPNRVIEE